MANVVRSMVVLAILLTGASVFADVEGTSWKIKAQPQDEAQSAGEKAYDDVLTFKGGQFTSQHATKQGCKPTQYEEDTRRFGPSTFSANAESASAGKIKWTGTITGTTIKGQVICTKKDGTTVTFDYAGERSDQ